MNGFSRRSFLGALGAFSAGVATHVLPPIRLARAQEGTAPKRLIVFFSPLGTIRDAWFPTGTETNFQMSPILAPLERHKSDLLIFKGLDQQREIYASANHQEMGGILTGTRVNGDEETSSHSNISVDQFIANDPNVTGSTAFKSISLAAWQGRYQHFLPQIDHMYMSAYGPNQAVVPWGLPQEAFDNVFGGFTAPPPGATGPDPRVVARRSVLDAIVGELETVQSKVASASERAKIEQHLTSVRELELRLQDPSPMVSGCLPPNRPSTYGIDDDDTLDVRIRLQIDLAVAALSCDRTRVIAITNEGGRSGARHPWLGIDDRYHEITHSPYSTEQTAIGTWYAEEFAYLLDRLEAIPEGDGTLLDNTCVAWVTEQGARTPNDEHSRDDMPWIIAGKCGGYFRTGRYLDVSGFQSNSFLVTLMNAMGIAGDSFGNVTASPLPNVT